MTIDVLFYGGHSWLDRAINRLTHGRYSHTAITVDGAVFEELAHGLVRHDGSAALSVAAGAAAYKRITVTDTQAQAVTAFLSRLVGEHAGYDYATLLVDAWDAVTGQQLVIGSGDRYVCSSAVSMALMLCGFVLPKDPHAMSPNDLARYLAPVTLGAPL